MTTGSCVMVTLLEAVIADTLSHEERSKRMALVKSRNTKPEMLVRRLLHSLGYRYRLHRKDLPGKPDIVFPSRRKIIQVHGCFWHQHPDPYCKLARTPNSRQEYWLPKLQRNREHDQANNAALENLGWQVIEVWECPLKDLDALERRLVNFLG